MLTSRLLAVTLACAVVGTTVPSIPTAHAQAADKKKQAKTYVDAGLAAEKSGDYTTAIEMYEKAYALIPHPVLLFNIANAYYLAKDNDKALEYYDKYLEAEPKGTQAKAAKARVKELTKAVADAKAKADADAKAKADADAKAKADADAKAKADADAKAKAKADADAKARSDADAAATAEADERARRKARADAQPRTFTPMRIAGVVAGGLGVVGLGGGVFFGMKAASISDELSAEGAVYDPAKVSDGESANTMMIVSYGVGAALVVTGAVLWVIGKDHRVAPVVTEDSAGLAFGGTF